MDPYLYFVPSPLPPPFSYPFYDCYYPDPSSFYSPFFMEDIINYSFLCSPPPPPILKKNRSHKKYKEKKSNTSTSPPIENKNLINSIPVPSVLARLQIKEDTISNSTKVTKGNKRKTTSYCCLKGVFNQECSCNPSSCHKCLKEKGE